MQVCANTQRQDVWKLLQNIDYSPNNRILSFPFTFYLQFKKIPILLTVRNFFSKYTKSASTIL